MLANKAKYAKIFLLLLFPLISVYPNPHIPDSPFLESIDIEPSEDELVVIERLIRMTEKQLQAQKRIKILIGQMYHDRELFLKGDQSKIHAKYMIDSASEMLSLIRLYRLQHLFSPEFMEEVTLYNQIGKKTPDIK